MLQTEVIESIILAVEPSSGINLMKFMTELSSDLQDLWWLLLLVTVFVACVAAMIFFCRKTHKVANNTILGLKQNKKYIPKVFVELNEGKDVLRYFIYGKKWKTRIIKAFNSIYGNSYGDILKNAVNERKRKFRLTFLDSFSDIMSAIQDKQELHKSLRLRKYEFKADYSESKVLFEICYYSYDSALNKLVKFTQSAMSRYLILTGSAGNGKTNLLCSISELIMKLKQAVVFITAREIKSNLEQYILECLRVPQFLKDHPRLYWSVENILLGIRKKYFYIVIDAVNENEDKEFANELSLFINEMLTFTRFKVIVSCRNEYYENRFREKLVDNINFPAFELDIKEEAYSNAALDRVFSVYKEYFNFTGRLSPAVKEVLCNQLLMLRIFFETYANKNTDVLSLCKHEVFKEYINKVCVTTSTETDKVLRKMARIMLDNNQYDSILVSTIENSALDINVVKKNIDESILISKKIINNEGTIAELENEVIYFVFDEMRDYILAREIITENTDIQGNVDSETIIKNIFSLKDRGSSAVEGIIHYTYVLFRTEKKIVDSGRSNELCAKLLDLVGIPEGREGQLYYGRRHRVEFQNLGLRIILTSGLPLTEVEMDYIRDCLVKNPREDGGIIFDVMLKGTILGGVYNLDTYLDILFGIHDKECMRRAFGSMKARSSYDDYYMPGNLEDIHRDLLEKNLLAAEQVHKIAELFLICFKLNDPNEQFLLENYFENLSNHQAVHEQMVERIKSALR